MGQKYEIVWGNRQCEYGDNGGPLLYQIRALRDIGDKVKKGDLGGWVMDEVNLSQEGDCWIDKNVFVKHAARVHGNAYISGKCNISDSAEVYGDVVLDLTNDNYSFISSKAKVYGNVRAVGRIHITDKAKVYGDCELKAIQAYVYIGDKASVYGKAKLYGNCSIGDYAKIHGDAVLTNTDVNDSFELTGNDALPYDGHDVRDLNINLLSFNPLSIPDTATVVLMEPREVNLVDATKLLSTKNKTFLDNLLILLSTKELDNENNVIKGPGYSIRIVSNDDKEIRLEITNNNEVNDISVSILARYRSGYHYRIASVTYESWYKDFNIVEFMDNIEKIFTPDSNSEVRK